MLGAGNANDLDLDALAAHFCAVHLVDIDRAALTRAAARQSPATRAKLHLHGGIELSGLDERLELWTRRAPDLSELVTLPERREPPAC